MKKYKIALLVGRFQPFHRGHLWLINHAFKHIDKLVIGVGSANIKNSDNFLNYEQRKKMLEMVFEKEPAFAPPSPKWLRRPSKATAGIVPLDDFFDDELWFKNSLKQAGKIDVVVGNNEWVNGIFEKRGYPILRVGFYKRYIYEGERIRRLMKTGGDWQSRVPSYLVNELTH